MVTISSSKSRSLPQHRNLNIKPDLVKLAMFSAGVKKHNSGNKKGRNLKRAYRMESDKHILTPWVHDDTIHGNNIFEKYLFSFIGLMTNKRDKWELK